MPRKLWVDDRRNPPDATWDWARTFLNAVELILVVRPMYDEISLDHDLDENEPTGYDLIKWMAEYEQLPRVIRIHSDNPVGAANMRAIIENTNQYPNRGMYGTGYVKEDL